MVPPLMRRWPDDEGPQRRLRVAVVEYPHVANATDLDALAAEPAFALRRVTSCAELAGADVVILPGSKETVSDLRWLRARGLDAALVTHAQAQPLLGICGGMQMLGERIDDPACVESGGSTDGLGLLPLVTTLATRKTTVRVSAEVAGATFAGRTLAVSAFDGYEIHVGATSREGAAPFAIVRGSDGPFYEDGAVAKDGLVTGTYVHGLFDDDDFRHAAVASLRARCGLAPAAGANAWRAEREARYDRLAGIVRAALDIPMLAGLAGLAPRVHA
jgi:adenosylcobyric acid synthase